MLICAPVAGLRPMRAFRFTNTSLPKPGIVKLFFAFLYASATMASRTSLACFFVSPLVSATDATICDLVNAFAIYVRHEYRQSPVGASEKLQKTCGELRRRESQAARGTSAFATACKTASMASGETP